MAINTMNSSDLDRKLRGLVGDERNVEVEFLLHLDRFDTALGYELFGLRTLWEYCRQELNLLEGAIWRRTNAMVLLRRFPQAEARLRDGRLSMTSLVMLGKSLTEQNVLEIFESVVGKSTRQIEEIVAAANSPRPEKTVVIRKLPAPHTPVPAPAPGPAPKSELATTIRTGIGEERAGLRAGFAGLRLGERITPIAREQYSVRLVFGSELKEKIEKAKKILSHKIPDGDVQKVIGEAIDRLIRDDEKRHGPKPARAPRTRAAAPRTRANATLVAQPVAAAAEFAANRKGSSHLGPAARRRAMPVDVDREVRRREAGVCGWKLANGETCGSTWQLEIDHIVPVAKGGATTAENCRLICRAHNQMHARNEFGAKFMARFSQKRATSGAGSRIQNAQEGPGFVAERDRPGRRPERPT